MSRPENNLGGLLSEFGGLLSEFGGLLSGFGGLLSGKVVYLIDTQ